MEYYKNIISSRKVRWVAGIIGALIVALLIFHAGLVIGARQGQFWRPMGGPDMHEHEFRPPFMPKGFGVPHSFIPNAHGAVGIITNVSLPTLTIKTRDGSNETVLVGTSTVIRSDTGAGALTDLSTGVPAVVLGKPDAQNYIEARVIHVFPTTTPTTL